MTSHRLRETLMRRAHVFVAELRSEGYIVELSKAKPDGSVLLTIRTEDAPLSPIHVQIGLTKGNDV